MITIDIRNYTQEERAEFISGWQDAGGDLGDPQCAPWLSRDNLTITADPSPRDAGALWWLEHHAASPLADESEDVGITVAELVAYAEEAGLVEGTP